MTLNLFRASFLVVLAANIGVSFFDGSFHAAMGWTVALIGYCSLWELQDEIKGEDDDEL
jgi:exosortase/archaeosortase family protein